MMEQSASWNGHDPTLSSQSQDDFQQFLDLGMNNMGDGLGFDFTDFNAQQNGQIIQQDNGEAMDTAMDGNEMMAQKQNMMQGHMPPMTTVSGHSTIPSTPIDHGIGSTESLVQLDAQIQYLQQQRQQEQQRQLQEQQRNYYAQAQSRMVPPTPNSMELHSSESQFFQQQQQQQQQPDPQQQAMYERYQMRLREQEMAFTPLVSPAVTPLEAHFKIPEYTVPGAYFSPLSSPALHAQNEHRSVYEARQADSSATTSPVEMNIDSQIPAPTSGSNLAKQKSNGRKTPTSKPRTPKTVRQSPIVKPQRRKQNSTVISPQTLLELAEPAVQGPETQTQAQSASHSAASTEGSENDSISPEHLSDMAPPPVPQPGSAGRSPYLVAQNGQTRVQQLASGSAMSPATPASLMRLVKTDQNQASPPTNNIAENDDHLMEGFSLPEAANPRPQLSRIETQSDGQVTPRIDTSVAQTPGFQPLPSPAFARPPTTTSISSPNLKSSNASAANTPGPRKTPQLAVRGSKKRHSMTSSVHVSPALRPRISPSIKPLIRGGSTVSDDTASLLLASKSNYQNILEGTHLPGVSYPTELSTNLTSKRTSHKIAEQGRRNRINSALQEIATLLPKNCGKDIGGDKSGSGADGEKDDGTETTSKPSGQSANSKASTVEMAIEYIKQLKREVEEANKRADEAEKKLELKVQ